MANVPLSPHAGATRGTLARYAHGNELLRRSAYADARSALNRYGFRVVLRTLIEKKGGIGSRLFRFFRLSRSPGFSASSASGSLALISSFAVLLCTFGFVWCRFCRFCISILKPVFYEMLCVFPFGVFFSLFFVYLPRRPHSKRYMPRVFIREILKISRFRVYVHYTPAMRRGPVHYEYVYYFVLFQSVKAISMIRIIKI